MCMINESHFVHEERGWFSVRRFDPCGEKASFISLKEQELIEILQGNCKWEEYPK